MLPAGNYWFVVDVDQLGDTVFSLFRLKPSRGHGLTQSVQFSCKMNCTYIKNSYAHNITHGSVAWPCTLDQE
jgi:hypothetical protein